MRKRTQMSLLVMTGLLSTGLGGCGTPKTQTAPETGNSESQSVSSSSIVKESHSVVDSSEDIITEDNYTEEDIKDAVSGIHDLYILQSADSPNLLHGICYDKDIVNSISASGSGIDLEKVGEYEVKYEVEINAEKLAEYLSSKENPKATPGGAKYTTNTNPVITITQKVSVVSETEAEKLADKDTVVIGSKDEICKKSDGTEVEEKTEIPESCKKKELHQFRLIREKSFQTNQRLLTKSRNQILPKRKKIQRKQRLHLRISQRKKSKMIRSPKRIPVQALRRPQPRPRVSRNLLQHQRLRQPRSQVPRQQLLLQPKPQPPHLLQLRLLMNIIGLSSIRS